MSVIIVGGTVGVFALGMYQDMRRRNRRRGGTTVFIDTSHNHTPSWHDRNDPDNDSSGDGDSDGDSGGDGGGD